MAFKLKTWVDRISEFPNRRKLDATGIADTYDVARSEGIVSVEGNKFNAAEMNDLEKRVKESIDAVEIASGTAVQAATIGGKPVTKKGTELQFPLPTSWIATAVAMGDDWTQVLTIPDFQFTEGCTVTFKAIRSIKDDILPDANHIVIGSMPYVFRLLNNEYLSSDAWAVGAKVTVTLTADTPSSGWGSTLSSGTAFFKGGEGGGGKYNVFFQPNEPPTKHGIWLKHPNTEKINKIVFDTNTWAAQTWKTRGNIANMPDGRKKACCATYGNEVFIFGGSNNASSYLASAIAYNPSTNTYRSLANMPETREEACCVVVGNEIFIFGGTNASSYLASAIAYNPSTNSYRGLADMPEVRHSACCVVVGNEVFIFSGLKRGEELSSAIAYNISTNSYRSLANMPGVRQSACCATYNNEVFIFGGFNESSFFLSSAIAYNISTNTYRGLTDMPEVSCMHCCVVVGNEVFIFGGTNNGSSYLASVIAYNPSTNTYRSLANMPDGRKSACCATYNNEVFIFGGYDNVSSSVDCMSLISKQYPNNGSMIVYYLPNDATHVVSLFTSKLCDYLPSYFKDVMWFKDGNLWFPELYVGNGSAWVKLR